LTGEGIDDLRAWLVQVSGWKPFAEGVFLARARHLEALSEAEQYLARAAGLATQFELFAEELRLAQLALGRITGAVVADDLLGEIFSSFCIGK
jgi:tRNA modification GTPase